MRVESVQIRNFRKLKNCHIDFGNKETIFVGSNNSGKTSAISAIVWFLRNNEKFTEPEKIVIRQTGDSIIATMIGSNIICRDNLHICIPHTQIDIMYVLGLLNSKLMNFVYGFINPERGEALAQVKKSHVELLPIKRTNNEQPIIKIVSKILDAKESNANADTQKLENEIDLLVYHLYGLTYDEVLIVDPGTPITREEYENFSN